jgi:hypothetical protein
LIKSRGVDAIINDSLIGNVLGFGMLFVGMVSSGMGVLGMLNNLNFSCFGVHQKILFA